jgi:hypothetical protein
MMHDELLRFAMVLILPCVNVDLLPCPSTTDYYGF